MSDHSISTTPFGKYQLSWWSRLLVNACQKLPANRIGKKIAFLLRKPVLLLNADPVDVTVDGLKLRLFPGANLSDKRLLSTPFLLDGVERRVLVELLPQKACVVDVGANIGGYSVLLMKDRPDLNIVAVEADPEIAVRLKNNIQLNKYDDRCQIVTEAVSDCESEVRLFRDHQNQGMNTLEAQPAAGADADYVTVPCRPLLSILNDANIDRPDHLKLDIEGHEHTVLSAFFKQADRKRWPTLIQIEQYSDEDLNTAVQLCLNRGYQIRLRARMNVLLEQIGTQAPESLAS